MNSIITLFIRFFGNVYYFVLNRFVKKEIVVLDTCFNNDFDGNIGAVYGKLNNEETIIVIKNNTSALRKGDILKKSFKYYYYLARAKLIVTNNAHHLYVNKNKNTTIINTWHGTPYKDVSINKVTNFILGVMNRNTTAHISGNKFFEEMYLKNTINFKGNIIKNGFFRNDVLLTNSFFYENSEFCKNGKKNILICPTWRDYGEDELVKKIVEIVKKLENKFYSKYNILLRMHNKSKITDKLSNLKYYDVSSEIYETQKLLKVTDILISDYSSIFFDFAILERPIILYQYDEELYKIKRGLLVENINKEYGINVFYDCRSICDFIDNINFEEEKYKINKFNKLIGNYESGRSLDCIGGDILF